ncbi:hypothetical protein KIN20_025075 [Parelaphostrongylus tenuis]|uniref:Uncharacterized protein n=1 Tax=Parelaphostrongylus tenuis TaxID=148309 RepID=A0AAD5QX44_PARTN|nr:hypothetical protein KIN20_025075 [Parelaphostrongylus tenuis]
MSAGFTLRFRLLSSVLTSYSFSQLISERKHRLTSVLLNNGRLNDENIENPKHSGSASEPLSIMKQRQSSSGSGRAPSLTATQEESPQSSSTQQRRKRSVRRRRPSPSTKRSCHIRHQRSSQTIQELLEEGIHQKVGALRILNWNRSETRRKPEGTSFTVRSNRRRKIA